jgi:hypothetical protein
MRSGVGRCRLRPVFPVRARGGELYGTPYITLHSTAVAHRLHSDESVLRQIRIQRLDWRAWLAEGLASLIGGIVHLNVRGNSARCRLLLTHFA